MWVKPVGWLLLLLLCARASFILAVNHSSAPSTRRQDEARGLSLTGGLPEEGVGGGPIGDKKGDIVSVSRKGGKGKGAYGGANVVHRPPRSSAAPSLVATSLFVPLLIFVSLGFNFIRT